MRVLVGVGLFLLFVVGAVLGLVIGFFVFWVSLVRAKRAVHFDGSVCRAEITARDSRVGPVLAGPAQVRLSGALEGQGTSDKDILGLAIKIDGNQDLVFGTFEGFSTATKDKNATNQGDYLRNKYSTVTPWWVPGIGPATLRIAPVDSASSGSSRIERLEMDIAANRARMVISIGSVDVAELRLLERQAIDASAIRISMFHTGRGIWPVGVRNGIRATVYPLSQLGRRIRGG